MSRFISTRGRSPGVSFREALFRGVAPDGGLYVPARIERLPTSTLEALRDASLAEVGVRVAAAFLGDDVPQPELAGLVADALSFPVPLVHLDEGLWALELWHGPTFAFKDVGARMMARLLAHAGLAGGAGAAETARGILTVLVATSGDTGGAVAHAFHGLAGTRVIVLYPEGQVSAVQEAQYATLGGNVTALAVAGTFDDCQRLVKQAFADDGLRRGARLASANSINIGRLLPQVVYYVHAAGQLPAGVEPVFAVPTGNAGNLTAGLMARALGAPSGRFVAACTINDTLPRYLATGRYEPRPSVSTLASAMDVGDPSNVERMRWLFQDDVAALARVVTASVHTDDEVRKAIGTLWQRHRYLADPHTAIGYLALRTPATLDTPGVFLSTAHPAKFGEIVEAATGVPVPLPSSLAEALARPRLIERIPARLEALARVLTRDLA